MINVQEKETEAGKCIEKAEDSTVYGEFISSYHKWISSEKQRKKARWLVEVTKELTPQRLYRLQKRDPYKG